MDEGILADYIITYPITFQDRTFNNRQELLSAVGNWGNIYLSSDIPNIFVSKGLAQWEDMRIFSIGTNSKTFAFTLYIFAKFVD